MGRTGARQPLRIAALLGLAVGLCLPQQVAAGDSCLTILHNNDAESQLLHAGPGRKDFGGATRFVSLVRQTRARAEDRGCAVLTLSSGDNFLAGPEFTASLEAGPLFIDSRVVEAIGYDALALGNHEFDFGPDVLADFLAGVDKRVPFLSANLDFADEPRLQALVDDGQIAKSTVIRKGRLTIGVIGATTEALVYNSSPRRVAVDPVLPAVRAEIDRLKAQGATIIVLISHLQGIHQDLALLPQLSDVDAAIAGGGDELLANAGDRLVPGDGDHRFGPYPLWARGADGRLIPVVTTPGDLKYLGRLELLFDGSGKLLRADGGLLRVAAESHTDGVAPDPQIDGPVLAPLRHYLDDLASRVIGISEVPLDGRRAPGVRTQETNLGNLMSDALLHQARLLAADYGMLWPDIAIQNGGGIRNNAILPAGPITELDTFEIAAFPNFVTIVEGVTPENLKSLLENALSKVELGAGRFPQISGFSIGYDPALPKQVIDNEQTVVIPGQRLLSLILDDGRILVQDGEVVPDGKPVTVATTDFLARGGDQYHFLYRGRKKIGLTYRQALANYIIDQLHGRIRRERYPLDKKNRIIPYN